MTNLMSHVAITFEFKKNKKKIITVTKPTSGKDIFPVFMW